MISRAKMAKEFFKYAVKKWLDSDVSGDEVFIKYTADLLRQRDEMAIEACAKIARLGVCPERPNTAEAILALKEQLK